MIKLSFLFIAVFFTTVNISRIFYKQQIFPINFILQSIGITGFIWLQWLN